MESINNKAAVYNLKRAAGVAAVLILLIWPAVFSNKIYAYFPFIAVLLMVILSVLLTFLIKRKIHFDAGNRDVECERGSSVPLALNVYNDSFLICPKAVAYLYITDVLGGTDTVTPAFFSMAAGGVSDFSFDIRMDHLGEYKAGIRSMELFDFLGLFKFPLSISQELTVAVMPRHKEDLEFSLAEQSAAESMDQKNAVVSDGFDYSGVREYAMGDSMKRIHWKLSAHTPNYMTKLMETSMRNDLAIIMDPSAPIVDRETLACLYDCLVESTLSLVHSAMTSESEYSVYYYGKDHIVESIVPTGQEDERNLIRRMAVIGSVHQEEDADGPGLIRKEAMISGGSSNMIMITTDLYEPLLDALIEVRQQGRNINLIYVLRHDMDSREREEAIRPLDALNEYDITCRIVLADAPGGEI